jgi:hypothetical protein
MATAVVDLTDWVTSWAAAHNHSHDDQLRPLQGKPALNAADRQLLARWKFESNRARLRRTLTLLARNEQSLADELTWRALACNDDLGAWLIAQQIHGRLRRHPGSAYPRRGRCLEPGPLPARGGRAVLLQPQPLPVPGTSVTATITAPGTAASGLAVGASFSHHAQDGGIWPGGMACRPPAASHSPDQLGS